MSSESSTSKFGLYRTIDARTEEFLRLSRKRQMRQGCICAAISTAITVAVVISIVLIYEYSNLSNAHTLKSNWLGLMNQTIDSLPFDTTQLNKAKLSFDHTTIELLPILLKAFKRNKYYDKEIEDTSVSPSPDQDNKDTTEYSKNVFSDARNWMKMPTSRVYAIEYKTSPIIYFKSPTRNVEYFTKIRKIRDYKRIMNYVDKMISDKATGSTQPLLRRDYRGHDKRFITSENTTPMPKVDPNKSYELNKSYHKKITNVIHKHKRTNHCNCSTRMGDTIRKIILSLQKLLPHFTNYPLKEPTNPCATERPMPVTESLNIGMVTPYTVRGKMPVLAQELTTTTMSYKKPEYSHETNLEKSIKNSASEEYYDTPKREPALNTIIKLLRPKNPKALNSKNITYYGKEKFQSYYHLGDVLPIQAAPIHNTSIISTTPKPIASYLFNRNKLNEHNFEVLPTLSPVFNDENYTDYGERTTNIVDIFDILDSHSLELVKKVMVSSRSDKKAKLAVVSKDEQKPNVIQSISRKSQNNEIDQTYAENVAKNNTWHQPEKINNMFATITRTLNKLATNRSRINTNKQLWNDAVVVNSVANQTMPNNNTENALRNPVEVTQSVTDSPGAGGTKPSNEQYRFDDLTLEEMERTSDEYIDEESAIRNIENILNSFKNESSSEKPRNRTTESSEMYQWELVKIEEHAKNLSSTIIAQNRPSYLEIQRNDWKREENTEYDTNINNYVFD